MIGVMVARGGAMHVARNRRTYTAKSGEQRVYESVLVRRTYRDGGKVRHETLANLSALPAEAVSAIEATLKGERLVPAGQAVRSPPRCRTGMSPPCTRPRCSWACPRCWARRAGPGPGPGPDHLPGGPAGLQAVHPDLVERHHPGRRPRRHGASTDDIYAAMDWLEDRQDAIEADLARRHLAPAPNPSKMALFDLSSSWLEGSQCPLAARGTPGRQERETADRVRAAHRPAGPPGRGPGVPRQHR